MTELERQIKTDDGRFWRGSYYAFQLQVPETLGDVEGGRYIYPLVLGPTGMVSSEPFATSLRAGLDGSLLAEENGIVARSLVISGTTGFSPKPVQGSLPPDAMGGFLFRGKWIANESFSGQRHFQFLQDRVFRFYSELKKNPTTAPGTKLFFLNEKDQEFLEVVPLRFDMTRSRVGYRYSIQLAVLNTGEAPRQKARQNDLDAFTRFIQNVQALIQDVANKVAELQNAVRTVLGYASALFRLVTEAVALVNSIVTAAADLILDTVNMLGFFSNLYNTVASMIDAVADLPRRIRDALSAQIFAIEDSVNNMKVSFDTFGDRFRSGFRRSANTGSLVAISDIVTGSRFSPLTAEKTFPYVVKESDTIETIALTYLGDATLWYKIADVNRLRPPYITNNPIPGTVRPGASLRIPYDGVRPGESARRNIFGATADLPVESKLFGRDLKLSFDGIQPDLVINNARTDFEYVSGLECLKQDIQFQSQFVRGADVLFPELGLPAEIGVAPRSLLEFSRVRAIEDTINADPRVRSVTTTLERPAADHVRMSIRVVPQGVDTAFTFELPVSAE